MHNEDYLRNGIVHGFETISNTPGKLNGIRTSMKNGSVHKAKGNHFQ